MLATFMIGTFALCRMFRLAMTFSSMPTSDVFPCYKKTYHGHTMTSLAAAYGQEIKALISNPKYHTDDFEVVYQPFLSKITIPKVISSVFKLHVSEYIQLCCKQQHQVKYYR